jgi:hypothetical protein
LRIWRNEVDAQLKEYLPNWPGKSEEVNEMPLEKLLVVQPVKKYSQVFINTNIHQSQANPALTIPFIFT